MNVPEDHCKPSSAIDTIIARFGQTASGASLISVRYFWTTRNACVIAQAWMIGRVVKDLKLEDVPKFRICGKTRRYPEERPNQLQQRAIDTARTTT